MGGVVAKLVFKDKEEDVKSQITDLWSINLLDIDEREVCLKDFTANKTCFLFVNVATKWGLTEDNYRELTDLYDLYRDAGL